MARILLIDTVYPSFIRWLYQHESELAAQGRAAQLRRATETGSHNVSVWAEPLRLPGHEVGEVWVNHAPLQHAWCREQGRMDLLPGGAAGLPALLAGPQPADWFLPVCTAQIRAFWPDILWLAYLYTFHDGFLAAVEGDYRHTIGQNAAVPPTTPLRRLDLVVSATAEDSECVAYDRTADCAEKACLLADHPAERAPIAARGQRGTLTDHTVFQRGPRIQDILAAHGMAA